MSKAGYFAKRTWCWCCNVPETDVTKVVIRVIEDRSEAAPKESEEEGEEGKKKKKQGGCMPSVSLLGKANNEILRVGRKDAARFVSAVHRGLRMYVAKGPSASLYPPIKVYH